MQNDLLDEYYYRKYLKYKNKYLELKGVFGKTSMEKEAIKFAQDVQKFTATQSTTTSTGLKIASTPTSTSLKIGKNSWDTPAAILKSELIKEFNQLTKKSLSDVVYYVDNAGSRVIIQNKTGDFVVITKKEKKEYNIMIGAQSLYNSSKLCKEMDPQYQWNCFQVSGIEYEINIINENIHKSNFLYVKDQYSTNKLFVDSYINGLPQDTRWEENKEESPKNDKLKETAQKIAKEAHEFNIGELNTKLKEFNIQIIIHNFAVGMSNLKLIITTVNNSDFSSDKNYFDLETLNNNK